jgi:hypothetical protein
MRQFVQQDPAYFFFRAKGDQPGVQPDLPVAWIKRPQCAPHAA